MLIQRKTIQALGFPRQPGLCKPCRGYTVLESVVVFGLAALLAGAAFVTLGNRSSGVDSTTARASLVQVLKLQASAGSTPNADTNLLGSIDPGRTFTNSASTNSSTVSVGASENILAAAVYDGEDCWMLVKNFFATSVAEREVWAVERQSPSCSATRALTVAVPDSTGATGQSADKPRIL